jgi:hypothetical protein
MKSSRKAPNLLFSHLEDVSWEVLERYKFVVKEMIRGKSGIYALYNQGHLYYVGLAGNLMGRLNSHLRDRHKGAWDRFSVYLTPTSDHTKELESMVLRIAKPIGNRVSGGFARSLNLYRKLNNDIAAFDADQRARLVGGHVAEHRRKQKAIKLVGASALAGVRTQSMRLIGIFKGEEFKALLKPDGTIVFNRQVYESPSAAGKAAMERTCNGWTFWKYRDRNKVWVPLSHMRK